MWATAASLVSSEWQLNIAEPWQEKRMEMMIKEGQDFWAWEYLKNTSNELFFGSEEISNLSLFDHQSLLRGEDVI